MKRNRPLPTPFQPSGWIVLGLVLVTLLAFWPVGRLGFINLDDYGETGYVVDNVHVHTGVTAASLKWAFTAAHSSNWHPLTWISHMLDYQWFGANPAGHHWMNLGWHIANACLLFLVLRQMTGKLWFATVAALLFAVHPLRVESVAWVSERKDVLSGFFFLLTLWAWAKHGQRVPAPAAAPFWKSTCYWLALAAFAGGLMSKPMLVTVPVILLLLDFWPLRRVAFNSAPGGWRSLLVEKLPFAVLALASCLVTIWAQSVGEAIVATERLPISWRLLNLPLCYAAYLKSIFWPQNLAVFYPYGHDRSSVFWFVTTVLLLGGFTCYCVRERRRHPWLLAGWCWFGVMLLPVIGLVQVGLQSTADRYTYLPSIGIALIVAWLLTAFATRSRMACIFVVVGVVALTMTLVGGVRQQLVYWKDSVTLFSRALAVNGENPMIRYYLANAYRTAGDLEGAAAQYQAILTQKPQSEDIQYRLGYVLMQQQKVEAASKCFEETIRLNPKNISAHMRLALLLVVQQKFPDAAKHFMAALLLRPGDPVIKDALKQALHQTSSDATLPDLLQLIETPSPAIHAHMAMIHLTRAEYGAAKEKLEAALALNPDDPEILNHLAWLLATCPESSLRNAAAAVAYAQRACSLTQNRQARTIITLSAALAGDGRFESACVQAQQVIHLASAADENDLVSRGQVLLELFRQRRAFIDAN